MPIYEYLCGDCGNQFEALVLKPGASGDEPLKCPACGKSNLEQQLSSFLSPVQGKLKPKPREHSEYHHGRLGKHD